MVKKTKVVEASPAVALGPRPRLVKLIIKNFRCIGTTPVSIDLDNIVVLAGPNNVGKSSVLKAYELVMSEGSAEGHLTIEDFPSGKVDAGAIPEIVTVQCFKNFVIGEGRRPTKSAALPIGRQSLLNPR